MATGNFLTRSGYTPGSGTADKPGLGFSSSNVGGFDETSAAIIEAIKKDAATNGLSQWGFSLLKQLGETIKPEWLKESSREWFNKPLIDPFVPPKNDFLNLVEPAVRSLTAPSRNAGEQGVMSGGAWTAAIRDKGGFGGLWEKYHKEVGDLDAQYAQLPAYLDPKRIAAKVAQFGPQGEALPGTPQTPSLRAQAEADAAKLKADQESYRAANSYQTIDEDNPPAGMTRAQARQRNRELNAAAEANFRAGHMGADDVLANRARSQAATPPGSPLAPFVPTGQSPGAGTTTNTFLPPYLQPGAGAGITGGPGTAPPTGQGFVPMAGAPPITPPGSPLAPFVPRGIPGQPPIALGLPPMAGVPRAGFGGGFAQTAKLLELPFYLRNLGRTAYG